MKPIINKILIFLLIVILSSVLGLYFHIKNTSDYSTKEGTFNDITGEVKVYRDDKGIPTIIAEYEKDLWFAQGYENARDRLWQLEFLRAVAAGELSELIGESLVESDIYLRTLSMRSIADEKYNYLNSELKEILNQFAAGLNAFITDHSHNPPLEFTILGTTPKLWKAQDILSIQGVMARTLSIGALNRELLRVDLAKAVGAEKALELFPIDYQKAAEFYLAQDFGSEIYSSKVTSSLLELDKILTMPTYGFDVGSNNWVVSGDKTTSGNPIMNNDPHLDLQTPSIWWQVSLYAKDTGFHVEGFALPAVPGVMIGHNERVSWGVTNTGTDAVDLFYFNTNDNDQYYYNNTWINFENEEITINVKDGAPVSHTIKRTVYGPVLDPERFGVPEDKVYVMRWTLLEDIPDDQVTRSIIEINRAENITDIHDALRYWGVPGQNFVFADVDGNIGYQYTGFIPKRMNNTYGVIPQNGSANGFEHWNGYIEYDDHLYIVNPVKGYLATANQKIDTRENFYITDAYASVYRGARINEVLEADDAITVDDMKTLQDDTKTLYADVILDSFILDTLKAYKFTGENSDTLTEAVKILSEWNRRMDREEIGASLFATFRTYLAEYTYKDNLDAVDDKLFPRYAGLSPRALKLSLEDKNNIWFDDVSTTEVETGTDIAIKAFEATINFLTEEIGVNIQKWEYGEIHEVVFSHVMGESLGFFNEGNKPSDGSEFTVKAAGGTPRWSAEGPVFKQGHGSSLRMIAEVEPNWDNVYGILAPGSSGHMLNKNRADGVEDWVENIYHHWAFEIEFDVTPNFTYKPE